MANQDNTEPLDLQFERLLEKASLAAAATRALRDAMRQSFRAYEELRLEPAEFTADDRKIELLHF